MIISSSGRTEHSIRESRRSKEQGVLSEPLVLAGIGIILWTAAAFLVAMPSWSFTANIIDLTSGRPVDVNVATTFLAMLFSVLFAVYLLLQGWKFLRAARDPFAREEMLGELRPRARELRYSLHLLRKSLLAMIGLAIIVVYVGMAILGPYLAPFPYVFSEREKHVPPGMRALQTELASPHNWTASTWINGSFALASDGLYAESDKASDILYLSNFSIPTYFEDVNALDIGVEAYSPEGHTVSVAVSWDGGSNWTPDQLVPFKTMDNNQLWFQNFGKDRDWSGNDLAQSNFVVRITHILGQGSTNGTVLLDYVQVRVTLMGRPHPWGTNELGQDVLTGILLGAAVDMRVAIIVVAATVAIGVALGVVSGFLGGIVDEIIMRITDMFLAIPGLIFALAIAAALGRSLENVLLALVIVYWPSYTRLVRGQALSIRETSYVEAARAVGAKTGRLVFRHILPNALSPVIVAATLDLGTIVLLTAGLSFIGIGAQVETPEWGIMISRGYPYMTSGYWWEFTIPGLAIFLFVLAFNLFGDGLRDILDPRLRR